MLTLKIPKIIPPNSRVRLLKADRRTPAWQNDVGRRFRVGYYSRKDGLDCVWLVNESRQYEQSTDRASLVKYFDIELLSREKNLYGRGKRRLRRIRIPTALERLNGSSTIEAYEGAKEITRKEDPKVAPSIIRVLLGGRRPFNRAAAAYALNLIHNEAVIAALERVVRNKTEHPKVRGQAAESLAHNHRPKSHTVVLAGLDDPSRDVRFWCAFSLAAMGDQEALACLKILAETDHRVVRGFWTVSKEARWAIREIRKESARQSRQRKACLYCGKMAAKRAIRLSRD